LGGSELRAGNVFTLTIYNSYIRNLQDRFPRLRGGDVHIFNSIYDATEVYETRNEVRELYPALFAKSEYNRQLTNQALVTTEQGAIFMENSIILGVSQVIKSNQVSRDHPLMTGKYLVEDSLYILGEVVFYGSSEDEGTAFIRANSEPILPFSWSTVTQLPYSGYQLIPVNVLEDFFDMAILGVTDQPFDWLTTESE
jgi:pectate lyase